jgi:hypothetical protein
MAKRMVSLLTALLLSAACAKIVVIPLKSGASLPKVKQEGLFYALPKTVVHVQLKVDKTVKKDAPYSDFAAIFAPDGQRACPPDECTSAKPEDLKTKVAFTIQDGGLFSTFGEPDPEQIFLVEFVGKGAIDQMLSMTWNEAGLLSTASASVTNRTADVVLSGVKLAASLGTKAGLGAAEERRVREQGCSEFSSNDSWVIAVLQNDEGTNASPTLIANYCDIPLKDRNKFDRRTEPLLGRANNAYVTRVAPLVNARTTLLTSGSQALDPVTLINKLDTLIDQQLRTLYLGSTKLDTWEGAFDVRDFVRGTDRQILKIVADKGLCVEPALLAPAGKAIPDGFLADHCETAKPVSLKLDFYPDEAHQIFRTIQDRVETPSGDRSFRYRIPAQVKATLAYDQKTYGSGVLSVAQFGHVVSLPAERHSKALSYDLAMIEATGGLKSFKLGSTGALDAGTVDALSAAGGTVLDARNAARKADQTAEDELTILTRQQMLLKLRDDICEIQKKHGLDCNFQP